MHPAAWPQWSRSCGNFRCLESLVADEGRFWTICHRGTAVHAKLVIQKLNGWAIPTRPSDGSLQMVRPAAWSGFEFCCCHWPTHSGIQQRAHGSRSDFTARKGAHQAVYPPSPGIHPASGVPVAKFQNLLDPQSLWKFGQIQTSHQTQSRFVLVSKSCGQTSSLDPS